MRANSLYALSQVWWGRETNIIQSSMLIWEMALLAGGKDASAAAVRVVGRDVCFFTLLTVDLILAAETRDTADPVGEGGRGLRDMFILIYWLGEGGNA